LPFKKPPAASAHGMNGHGRRARLCGLWWLPAVALPLLLLTRAAFIGAWDAAPHLPPPSGSYGRMHLRDAVGGHAAPPGGPSAPKAARPLSLASADFDEDGVPDLISGYAHAAGGILSLNRGNVDSIYPNAPEAALRRANGADTDAPFLSPSRAFPVGGPPDFIAAGDFDGDGHWDVVAASRGGNVLHLLAGDGRGGLSTAQRIEVQGAVTALTSGEVNRADGLTDVVVAVAAGRGARVLVYEGPEGALRSDPEVFPAASPVTSLALGQFDDVYTRDLAVASGAELLVFHGRDRKLSQDDEARAAVGAPAVSRRSFDSPIKSLAVGDFVEGQQTDIALLHADGEMSVLSRGRADVRGLSDWRRETATLGTSAPPRRLFSAYTSGGTKDDLMVVGPAGEQVRALNSSTLRGGKETATSPQTSWSEVLAADGELLAVLPMRLDADALSDLVILRAGAPAPAVALTRQTAAPLSPAPTQSAAQTFTVVNTNNSGPGSLRQAVLDANANPGPDTIVFQIGSGLKTINSAFPALTITDAVIIDGTTQPGFAGQPLIELTGFGLTITAGRSVVRGLVLNRGAALRLETNGGNIVEGNYLGTDVTGTILLRDAASGNLGILSPDNKVGGTTAAARNVIAGAFGIGTTSAGSSTGNVVQGNFIGTDATGTASIGTPSDIQSGLTLTNASNNIIGGTTAGARNVISCNRTAEIMMQTVFPLPGEATGNLVQGNLIGTDVTGTVALPNTADPPSYGVFVLTDANENTIGGTTIAARNVISGLRLAGIAVAQNFGTLIQGNFIGTDITGLRNLGNGGEGVLIQSSRNTVGGATPGARNVISGNLTGVFIRGEFSRATDNKVQGNYIGTDASGSVSIPNGHGVRITIEDSVANNTIGGDMSGTGNLISGNSLHGIIIGLKFVAVRDGQEVEVTGGTGILVQGNSVGTDASGLNPLGNDLDGIFIDADSFANTIAHNTLAYNGRNGVSIPNNSNPGVRIFLDNNHIFGNGAMGIDLGAAGVTANDPGDPDVGANLQQNFPTLTSGAGSASPSLRREGRELLGTVTVNGTLNSTPNTAHTIHWYFTNATQCVSNQTNSRPLVTGKVANVVTDASGNAPFSFPFTFPQGIALGVINCTATDPQGNTSEFSSCMSVSDQTVPPFLQFSAPSLTVSESGGGVSVAVTRGGDTSAAASVNYVTASGTASDRSDFTASVGTLRFGPHEITKSISVLVADDVLPEGTESFTVALSSATGGALGSPSVATVSIADNDSVGPTPTNPLDLAQFFARQHYADFLNRDPDADGLQFWAGNITSCGADAQCVEVKRVNVSASFYLSIEFQETGYLVYRTHKAAYGNLPGKPIPVRLSDFLMETRMTGEGVVVGVGNWPQKLEENKAAYFAEFVARPSFTALHPPTLNAAQFVDGLFARAAVTPLPAERQAAIAAFGAGGVAGRASALRAVAEAETLRQAEKNRAFVLMQYFGYLRRNPDDVGFDGNPDPQFLGFNHWLGKLNQFNGNFEQAEMVRAFISSIEYRRRFGP
jgi:hypothetical protein